MIRLIDFAFFVSIISPTTRHRELEWNFDGNIILEIENEYTSLFFFTLFLNFYVKVIATIIRNLNNGTFRIIVKVESLGGKELRADQDMMLSCK